MMKSRTPYWLALALPLLAISCSRDGEEVTAPSEVEVGVLANSSPTEELRWFTHDLTPTCQGGQLQSAYPLDAEGDLILVGTAPCRPDTEDWQVYDLSSGVAVLVDEFNNPERGFNLAAHSPRNSEIGFGGEGNRLIVYDGGFSFVMIPCTDCTILSVWAGSPTDVWIVATGQDLSPSRIYYWDGQDVTLEHEGGSLGGIWGPEDEDLEFEEGDDEEETPTALYATGDRILKRDRNGNWSEVVSPGDPGFCGTAGIDLYSVVGVDSEDVWATGFSQCIMHFDGETWSAMPIPDNSSVLGGIWPLDEDEIVVSGQGGQDPSAGKPALWGSADGGTTWTQFEDPAFVGLTIGEIGYFNLAATIGGRIIAPGIRGVLAIGVPDEDADNFASTSVASASRLTVRAAVAEEAVSSSVVRPKEQ